MIGLASKSLDEVEAAAEEKNRFKIRRQFWKELLKVAASKSPRFQNISPGIQSWISAEYGVRGVPFNFAAGKAYSRVELYLTEARRTKAKQYLMS